MHAVRGVAVDKQGRCSHYNSQRDVVANRCATCGTWWACHRCHDELTDHPFGRMPLRELAAMCGVCGHEMTYAQYSARPQCPSCGHPFNPGCSLHAHLYFEVD